MSPGHPIRRLRFIALAALLTFCGGCISIDRRGRLGEDLNSPLAKEDVRSIVLPETVQTEMTEAPPFTLPEAGPVDLSIEQAMMLALRHNRDLKVRQINPVIAGAFEQIERGRFDPEVFANLEFQKERASETDRATGTQFNVEGSDREAVAGIRQDLPTGTGFEVTIGQERQTSDRTPEQQIARIGLSLTQSLLQGFGPAVNLVRVRQAEMDTLASFYELRGFTERLLADTETTYWNYRLARQKIEIFEESLALAKKQRDEVALRIEVGVLPSVEAAAGRAEVSRREQDLIDARSLVEENRLRLLRLVSPDPMEQLDLRIQATSEPAILPEPIRDSAERIQLAERFRADLREAQLRLRQNRLETVATRNGLLPRLDLFIVLGQTGFSDSFSGAFQALDENTYDAAAGFQLSRFLGNRAAEAAHLAARAARQQAAEAVDNLRQLIRLDVLLAINEAERAREQISATRATRVLQEATLKAEQERFDVGSSTALLVAQAQRDLLASRIAEVEAIVQYRIALVDLYRVEGSLLERRGIVFDVQDPLREQG